MAIDLISDAVSSGARQTPACEILGVTSRTFRRWLKQLTEEQSLHDRRKEAAAIRVPSNKLSEEEKTLIVDTCNQQEYRSLPPTQIVPTLADNGIYIGSESTFYRVLKEVNQVNRRGRAEKPRTVAKPKGFKATSSNQVWSWDSVPQRHI